MAVVARGGVVEPRGGNCSWQLASPASCHTRCNPRIVFCRGCREQKLNEEHGRISEKTPK